MFQLGLHTSRSHPFHHILLILVSLEMDFYRWGLEIAESFGFPLFFYGPAALVNYSSIPCSSNWIPTCRCLNYDIRRCSGARFPN